MSFRHNHGLSADPKKNLSKSARPFTALPPISTLDIYSSNDMLPPIGSAAPTDSELNRSLTLPVPTSTRSQLPKIMINPRSEPQQNSLLSPLLAVPSEHGSSIAHSRTPSPIASTVSSPYHFPYSSRDHSPFGTPLPSISLLPHEGDNTTTNTNINTNTNSNNNSNNNALSPSLLSPPELRITITSPPPPTRSETDETALNFHSTSSSRRNSFSSTNNHLPSLLAPPPLSVAFLSSPQSLHGPDKPTKTASGQSQYNNDYLTPEPYQYSSYQPISTTPNSRRQSVSSVSSVSSSNYVPSNSATPTTSNNWSASKEQKKLTIASATSPNANSSSSSKKIVRARRKEPSCDSCRERKVKCDATGQQACSVCISRGIKCQFTRDVNRRRSNNSSSTSNQYDKYTNSNDNTTNINGNTTTSVKNTSTGSNISKLAKNKEPRTKNEENVNNLVSVINDFRTFLEKSGVNVPAELDDAAKNAMAEIHRNRPQNNRQNKSKASSSAFDANEYQSYSSSFLCPNSTGKNSATDYSANDHSAHPVSGNSSNGYLNSRNPEMIPSLYFSAAGMTGSRPRLSINGPQPGNNLVQPTPYIAKSYHQESPLVVYKVLKFLKKFNRGAFDAPPGYILHPEPILKSHIVGNDKTTTGSKSTSIQSLQNQHIKTHNISKAFGTSNSLDMGQLHKYVPRKGLADLMLKTHCSVYQQWMPPTVWKQITSNLDKLTWSAPEHDKNCKDMSQFVCTSVPNETWVASFFAGLALGLRDNVDPEYRILKQGDQWIEIAAALTPMGPHAESVLSREWVIGAYIIAIYMAETRRRGMSNIWMCHAIQASQQCGISQGLALEDQHLWWALFSLDRIQSLWYCRDVLVQEKSLPCSFLFHGYHDSSDYHKKDTYSKMNVTESMIPKPDELVDSFKIQTGYYMNKNPDNQLGFELDGISIFQVIFHIIIVVDISSRILSSQKTISRYTMETLSSYFETFWSLMSDDFVFNSLIDGSEPAANLTQKSPINIHSFIFLLLFKWVQYNLVRLNFSPSAQESQLNQSMISCYAGAQQVFVSVRCVMVGIKNQIEAAKKSKSSASENTDKETGDTVASNETPENVLANFLTVVNVCHIWQCCLILLAFEDYDASLLLINVLEACSKAKLTLSCYGRYIDGFVRLLRKEFKVNEDYNPVKDRVVIALLATDLLSMPQHDWIFSRAQTKLADDIQNNTHNYIHSHNGHPKPQQNTSSSNGPNDRRARSKSSSTKKSASLPPTTATACEPSESIPTVVIDPASPDTNQYQFLHPSTNSSSSGDDNNSIFDEDADADDEEEGEGYDYDGVDSFGDITWDGFDENTVWKDWAGLRMRIEKLKVLRKSKIEQKIKEKEKVKEKEKEKMKEKEKSNSAQRNPNNPSTFGNQTEGAGILKSPLVSNYDLSSTASVSPSVHSATESSSHSTSRGVNFANITSSANTVTSSNVEAGRGRPDGRSKRKHDPNSLGLPSDYSVNDEPYSLSRSSPSPSSSSLLRILADTNQPVSTVFNATTQRGNPSGPRGRKRQKVTTAKEEKEKTNNLKKLATLVSKNESSKNDDDNNEAMTTSSRMAISRIL